MLGKRRVEITFERMAWRTKIIGVSALRQLQQQLNGRNHVILMHQIDPVRAALDVNLTGQETPWMTIPTHQPCQAQNVHRRVG
ncbi:hypothetical protein D3C72_1957290 [compost metagenome]